MMTLLTVLGIACMVLGLAGLGWLLAVAVLDAAPLTPEERAQMEREWLRHGDLTGGFF